MANDATAGDGMMPADTSFDLGATWGYLMAVARLEDGVFGRLARDETQSVAAVVLPAVLMLGGTISSWLYLLLAVDANVDAVGVILRGFVLGTIAGWGAWAGWAALTSFLLSWRWGHEVERWPLMRALGFATLPLVLTWVTFLPDTILGNDPVIGQVALPLMILAVMATAIFALHAVREAVPDAREREVTLATLGGYVAALAVLGLLASKSGIAPIFAIFTQGFEYYVDFGSIFS